MELSTFRGLLDKVFHFASFSAWGLWGGFPAMASENKIPKIVKRIGTHSGVFHCDEALACYMLKQLPEYRDADIIRSRDNDVLATCDIVVDVGGIYDPKTNRYDHHQRDFKHTLSMVKPDLATKSTIKLSSAGLVYAHFGFEVIEEIMQEIGCSVEAAAKEKVYVYVYERFVEEVDAIDNGIPMFPEGKPQYGINTHLSARIHRLNPEWNSREDEPTDVLFEKAMAMAGADFKERIIEALTVWYPARQIVAAAIENRQKVHKCGEIIALIQRCPWKEHLLALEEELGIQGVIKFVVFYDGTDSWRVQAVPNEPDSFICRVFLHEDWRGVRDEELSKISGIKGCIFCHGTGFIGGNTTKAGALNMALKSLKAVFGTKGQNDIS